MNLNKRCLRDSTKTAQIDLLKIREITSCQSWCSLTISVLACCPEAYRFNFQLGQSKFIIICSLSVDLLLRHDGDKCPFYQSHGVGLTRFFQESALTT